MLILVFQGRVQKLVSFLVAAISMYATISKEFAICM